MSEDDDFEPLIGPRGGPFGSDGTVPVTAEMTARVLYGHIIRLESRIRELERRLDAKEDR